MTGFTDIGGRMHADGVSLDRLAERFGTPCYVYSSTVIEAQFKTLATAMAAALPQDRRPLLCYACKANSNIAILSLLRQLGSGLEVVSEGELARGLRAGFDPGKIVATGVGKQPSEIAAQLRAGILQQNVESLPELETINRIAGELGKVAQIAFRLNPDVTGGGHHKISTGRSHDKFGISKAMLFQGYAMAKDMPNVQAAGLSMHIGSQVFEVGRFREAFAKLPDIVRELRSSGYSVERLDIGGGFPIVYRDETLLDLDSYAQWVRDIIAPLDAQIILEPGRYLVGNAGVVLTRVIHVKETESRKFLVLDAAMNDLIRPAMYDAYHGIEPVDLAARGMEEYDIVGPVCETGDSFATNRMLPALQGGDLAVIKSAGAYGASMASNYNTRPLAAEILVKDGNAYPIRDRQTYEEIMARETIPPFLISA